MIARNAEGETNECGEHAGGGRADGRTRNAIFGVFCDGRRVATADDSPTFVLSSLLLSLALPALSLSLLPFSPDLRESH